MDCSPPGSSALGDSPGKNTEVGCHFLLQQIFLTQGLNPDLPHCRWILYQLSFQGSPFFTKVDGKESACSAGDLGSIAGSGRSPGKGMGYPLQYSWASLVTQRVKNPPAVWEIWVQSLGWEDPLEEGMATHLSIFAWRIPMDRGAWRPIVHGFGNSWT